MRMLVCVFVCVRTHMCKFSCTFSPLSKDSWALAAAGPIQTQKGSSRQQRVAMKSPDSCLTFSTFSVNITATPEIK